MGQWRRPTTWRSTTHHLTIDTPSWMCRASGGASRAGAASRGSRPSFLEEGVPILPSSGAGQSSASGGAGPPTTTGRAAPRSPASRLGSDGKSQEHRPRSLVSLGGESGYASARSSSRRKSVSVSRKREASYGRGYGPGNKAGDRGLLPQDRRARSFRVHALCC